MVAKRVLYVEGGEDKNPSLASECRRAFSKLFERCGVKNRPRVVACGGRKCAYDQFCQALEDGTEVLWLLVDAEDCVEPGPPFEPWKHVASREGDGWAKPQEATDEHLHFMNVVMETWLLADPDALKKSFGPKFDGSKLFEQGAILETKRKSDVYAALSAATKNTPAGSYGKGDHSFKILAEIDPERLQTLTWARRFLDAIEAPK